MGFPILAALAAAPSILDAGEDLIKGITGLFGEDEDEIKEALEIDPTIEKGVELATKHNVIAKLIESFLPTDPGAADLDESEAVLNDYIQLNLHGAIKGIESRMELLKMKAAMESAGISATNGFTPDGQVAASEPIQFAQD